MDKYTIAPPAGSTNNSVGAEDRPWKSGHFDSVKLNGGDLGEYLAESTGYGIVSGCEPSISGLTVTVAAGVVHLANGTRKEISSTNITLDAADTTNPRIDLVYINSDGVVAKITGTAAASPSAPTLPTGGISVCNVTIAAGATTGTVTDKRKMLNPCFYYDSVSSMMSDKTLKVGAVARTLGYYSANDGGGALYTITDNSTVYHETLGNGLFAEITTSDDRVSLACFGAKENDANSPADAALDAALSFCVAKKVDLYVPPKNYYVNGNHTLTRSLAITGDYVRGENVGDGRENAYNFIFTGTGYLFELNYASAHYSIRGIAAKGDKSNEFVKIAAYRNVVENCYLRHFDKAIHLTRISSSTAAVSYENFIRCNFFYENAVSIFSEYDEGDSTDGYITDNIFANSWDGTLNDDYSISAESLAEWIIARNHDYTHKGISVQNAANLMIDGNYFDNASNTSLTLYVNGACTICNNKFLVGVAPETESIKINLLTKPEFQAARAIVANNLVVASSVPQNNNTRLLLSTIPVQLCGNSTDTILLATAQNMDMIDNVLLNAKIKYINSSATFNAGNGNIDVTPVLTSAGIALSDVKYLSVMLTEYAHVITVSAGIQGTNAYISYINNHVQMAANYRLMVIY